MTAHRLPPMNALRAFEAAARHRSVKAAAAELCVTPGAVSQMLKALELHLGVKLFHRVNRGIVLTDAGQGYLPPVRNAFSQIAEASARVTVGADSGVLTVSVTPFFAAAWLVPRVNSAVPNSSSTVATRLLTALAVTCSSSAARSKLPWRAAASKARKPSIEGRRTSGSVIDQ